MTVLTAINAGLWFGDREIMSGVNFSVENKSRIALVGVNGCGKTSLMKMITGQLHTDEGEIVKGKFVTVGYMEQISINGGCSVYEETLLAFSDLISREEELEGLSKRLENETSEALAEEYNRKNESFVADGGLTFRARTRSALLGLGFTAEQLEQQADTLSGGQHSKLQLCKLLLSGANLLLLDEPTNHLDIRAIEWLESFLISYPGAYIVVSHDRYFLDKVTEQTLELENRRVTLYKGSYSRYLELKAEARENAVRQNENTMRRIKHIEATIEQQRRWNQERNYVTIASKKKHIERLEDELVEIERTPEKLRFKFDVRETVCNEVIKADRLAMSYGEKKVFSDVDLLVMKGERVFLIGANGCGKSTLLKILASRMPGTAGSFLIGPGIVVGYFDQTLSTLHNEKTVLNELWDEYPRMTETQIRTALGSFLFHGDDVFKQVASLSGGEKARLALLKLMMTRANLLLLDEPTNHLDIASREALENALLAYDGTMLIVSHDRYLINKLASRIYHMENGKVASYDGNYDAFEEQYAKRHASQPEQEEKKAEPKVNEYQLRKERQSQLRKAATRISRLEQRLEEIDSERSEGHSMLEQPEISSDYANVLEITEKLAALDDEENSIFAELEELYAVTEGSDGQ